MSTLQEDYVGAIQLSYIDVSMSSIDSYIKVWFSIQTTNQENHFACLAQAAGRLDAGPPRTPSVRSRSHVENITRYQADCGNCFGTFLWMSHNIIIRKV